MGPRVGRERFGGHYEQSLVRDHARRGGCAMGILARFAFPHHCLVGSFGGLIGTMALTPTSHARSDATMCIPGFGDNRGNKYALSYLQSSEFPLCTLVMELAAQLESKSQRLDLTWTPREGNEEADRLFNGNVQGFCESNRAQFNLKQQN